ALINMDRLHTDPASGILVDQVSMNGTTPTRGTTLSTPSLAYTMLGLRTVLRALSSQLELYSNNTPDTAIASTPLDTLPTTHPPGAPSPARLTAMVPAHAALLLDHLTDASGRAFSGWDVAAMAPINQDEQLDSYTGAVRGLFAAYLATGDARYHDRALAV